MAKKYKEKIFSTRERRAYHTGRGLGFGRAIDSGLPNSVRNYKRDEMRSFSRGHDLGVSEAALLKHSREKLKK